MSTDPKRHTAGSPGSVGGQFAPDVKKSVEGVDLMDSGSVSNDHGLRLDQIELGKPAWVDGERRVILVASGIDEIRHRGYDVPEGMTDDGTHPVLVSQARQPRFYVESFDKLHALPDDQQHRDAIANRRMRSESLAGSFRRAGIEVDDVDTGIGGYTVYTSDSASARGVGQVAMDAFDADPESGDFSIRVTTMDDDRYATVVKSKPESTTPSPESLASRSNAILACKEYLDRPMEEFAKVEVTRADHCDNWNYQVRIDDLGVDGHPI